MALVLLIVATVAITIWWIQRPIKPVVLSPKEKATVEAKLRRLEGQNAPASAPATGTSPAASSFSNREPEAVELPRGIVPGPGQNQDRTYVPGGKVFTITEREINGLLNANTDLGKSVRLQLDKDAVNAYLAVRIPDDFPIGAGKMFRARGRFKLSLGNGGKPYAILEDVTVFGISLPKAWLGGLKGENLIGEAMTGRNDSPVFPGIKSLRVEPGALVIEVTD